MPPYSDKICEEQCHPKCSADLKISIDSKNSGIRSTEKKFGLSEATLRHAIQNDGHLKSPGHAKILSYRDSECCWFKDFVVKSEEPASIANIADLKSQIQVFSHST